MGKVNRDEYIWNSKIKLKLELLENIQSQMENRNIFDPNFVKFPLLV